MNASPVLMLLAVPSADNAIALLVYALLLIAVIAISRRYRCRALKRMERPRGSTAELDLYDLAFLSGGAQRMLQLAVFRLHGLGLLTQKKGWFSKPFVPVRGIPVDPENSTLLERLIHKHSLTKDRLPTLADSEFRSAVNPLFQHVETKMANQQASLEDCARPRDHPKNLAIHGDSAPSRHRTLTCCGFGYFADPHAS